MPMAMASGASASTPTSTVSSFCAPAFSSSCRAIVSRGALLAEVGDRPRRWPSGRRGPRFSARASPTMRPSQTSSLILRSRVPETPAGGRQDDRAGAGAPPRCSAGSRRARGSRSPRVTSVMGMPKRRSGLSRAVAQQRLGVGEARERPLDLHADQGAAGARRAARSASKIVSMRGNDISTSTCVNSGWRSARRSSSRKQRTIWK